MNIINRYVNTDEQNEPLSLLFKKTQGSDSVHPYLNTVITSLLENRISLANTRKLRKRHSQKKSSIQNNTPL